MDILATLAALYKNRVVIGVTALVVVFVSFYIYYLHTTHRIEILERDNIEMSKLVDKQQKQIEAIRKNYDEIVKAKDDLFTEIEKLKQEQKTEEDKIYRERKSKKSLEELAIKKSKLVERVINKATQNVFTCFETLSRGGDC